MLPIHYIKCHGVGNLKIKTSSWTKFTWPKIMNEPLYMIYKWSALVSQLRDCFGGWIGWRLHWTNVRCGARTYALANVDFLVTSFNFQPWKKEKRFHRFGHPAQSANPFSPTDLWPVPDQFVNTTCLIPVVGPDYGPVPKLNQSDQPVQSSSGNLASRHEKGKSSKRLQLSLFLPPAAERRSKPKWCPLS